MPRRVIKGLLLVIALLAAWVAFVRFNQPTLPEGPVPVVWDREVCGHCKMHVGDPRFAAQLHTTEGEIVNFDDPGCLFDYLHTHDVSVHALYFRNSDREGWLSESSVGFVAVEDSPMGYGIRAVPKAAPEAQSIEWAKARAISRPHQPNGGT